jgi:glycosyltransferase involved in cell wall biosynthesis
MSSIAKTSRVSVIIPCYNSAPYVAEAIASVFAQTYRDFEVVVVNDGSQDTPDLELALAPWMDSITYIKTHNQGPAAARNTGIRASRSELIALLDSDDVWHPNYLSVQIRELDDHPSADIVYPRSLIFGGGEGSGTVSEASHGEVTFKSLVEERCVPAYSILGRRVALERAGLFDPDLIRCEDFDMWLRCVKSGIRIIYHQNVLLQYRRRPNGNSLSSDPIEMFTWDIHVLSKMRTAVQMTVEESEALESAIRKFEGKRLFFQGKRAFVDGDIPSALDFLKQANSHLPGLRFRTIVCLVSVMPQISRTVYLWMLRRREAESLKRSAMGC